MTGLTTHGSPTSTAAAIASSRVSAKRYFEVTRPTSLAAKSRMQEPRTGPLPPQGYNSRNEKPAPPYRRFADSRRRAGTAKVADAQRHCRCRAGFGVEDDSR